MNAEIRTRKNHRFINRAAHRAVCALGLATLAACANSGNTLAAGPLRDRTGSYELEVIADGNRVPVFFHQGESFVLGQQSQRYVLRVHNRSPQRVEAVVSVDGIDVVDGKSASFDKRGYLVPAWGSVDIDGWRLSNHEAAAFRFSSVRESYAGKTGRARNVGVIGVAIFPERRPNPPPRPIAPYNRYNYDYNYNYRNYGAARGRDDSYGPNKAGEKSAAESQPSRQAPANDPSLYADGSVGHGGGRESGAPSTPAPSAASGGAWMDKDEAKAPRDAELSRRERPGLGTEFGEAVGSAVQEVEFARANAHNPAALLGVRYNDRQGLVALGIDVDGQDRYWSDSDWRSNANPFPVSHNRFARPPRDWNRE